MNTLLLGIETLDLEDITEAISQTNITPTHVSTIHKFPSNAAAIQYA